ncbi:unnamed protein product [Meloidogyne enterolobii]|uniref:Uncharacterized protein n=1 Tax=Meloidogyne enterolobii TaxID=390850 RepID=A0ACB0Z440_MELEN
MGAVVVLFLFAVVGAVAGAYKYGYLDPYVEQLQQAMGQKSGN